MSAMTNGFETTVLNTFRGTAATAPQNVYLALFLSSPTESGTAGMEVSYSGYVRQKITFSAPAASGTDVSIQNNALITFPTPPGASGTATYGAIMDDISGGDVLVYCQLNSPIALTSEVSPRLDEGDVKLVISAGNFTANFKNKILNYLRGTNIAGFEPHLALYDGSPEEGGAELSGSGYARLPLIFGAPSEQVSGQMEIRNTNAAQSNAAIAWGTWAYGAVMDAETSGNCVAYKANAGQYVMDSGAKAYIDANSISMAVN